MSSKSDENARFKKRAAKRIRKAKPDAEAVHKTSTPRTSIPKPSNDEKNDVDNDNNNDTVEYEDYAEEDARAEKRAANYAWKKKFYRDQAEVRANSSSPDLPATPSDTSDDNNEETAEAFEEAMKKRKRPAKSRTSRGHGTVD